MRLARGKNGDGQREENGDGKRPVWGNRNMIQCIDDVSLSCILEICLIFQNSVTPINSVKTIKTNCF